MEGELSVEHLSQAEKAIVDLLTFHYVEGFKFNFTTNEKPILSDVKNNLLVSCQGIFKFNDKFARFDTPENHSNRKDESLGALYYVLTGIRLAEDHYTLFSDNYTAPGQLSDTGKGLWEQLIFLGLAENLSDIKHFKLSLPPKERIKALHEKARREAFDIYKSGRVSAAVKEIQARLRLPAAGEILVNDI